LFLQTAVLLAPDSLLIDGLDEALFLSPWSPCRDSSHGWKN